MVKVTKNKQRPRPRQPVYDTYWRFAAQRQAIFDRRFLGAPPPWTDDPILLQYKFTNVFRAADRVSQYMIRQVCYHDEPASDADRLFQIVLFRTLSKIETWQGLRRILGHYPRLSDLKNGTLEKALNHLTERGPIYTSAFILCANDAYGRGHKHLNHLALMSDMFLARDLATDLLKAKSLGAVFALLRNYPLMGDFMSYQTAIDLNYSCLINFSENDFTVAGPGARRGIAKCFESRGQFSDAEIIQMMVENQATEFKRLGLQFGGLFGRPLHAIDAQNLFCEVDKYSRVAFPKLASGRVRIKQSFRANRSPIDYFFPPKWGIEVPAKN
jgi:hypothetical protein